MHGSHLLRHQDVVSKQLGNDSDEEDIDEKTARELGVTVRLLKAGEDYYRQLQEERVRLFDPADTVEEYEED